MAHRAPGEIGNGSPTLIVMPPASDMVACHQLQGQIQLLRMATRTRQIVDAITAQRAFEDSLAREDSLQCLCRAHSYQVRRIRAAIPMREFLWAPTL